MSPAPVTAIIPTFNSGHLVTAAVDSALGQTTPPEAVVVVDDGSTDDTPARLAAYGRRVRYIRQPNGGVSAARNRGVSEATSEFVAFLDADDVWHPRKLELQLGLLRSRPELGLLGTGIFPWPGRPPPAVPDGAADARLVPVSWGRLVVRNFLVTSSIVVRRSVLERTGGFDPGLQGPEDYDLWLRVAEAVPAANLELPLTGYADVPGSLSKQARRMEEGKLRILDKLAARGTWRGQPWLRRKAYSMVYLQAAYMYGGAGAHATAIRRSLRALACYPWPYGPRERNARFERPKWLARSLVRLLGRRTHPR